MAKYFEADYRRGSFQDRMGRAVTIVGGPELNRTEKGLAVKGFYGQYLQYNRQIIPDNAFTIVAFVRYRNRLPVVNESNTLVADRIDGVTSNIGLQFNVNGLPLLMLGSSNYRYYNYSFDKNWHCIIVTVPGTAQLDILNAVFSIDNIPLSTYSTVTTGTQFGRGVAINTLGTYYSGSGSQEIAYLATFDHVLNEHEKSKINLDFLNSFPILPEKYPQQSLMNKPIDLSREKNNTYTSMIPSASSIFNTDGTTWWTRAGVGTFTWNSSGYATLTSAGGQPFIYRAAFGTVGKTYRFKVRLKSDTYAEYVRFYIGTALYLFEALISPSWTEYNFNIYADDVVLYAVPRVAFTGSIDFDHIIVEEISGLVAAYNMIPNGSTLVDISGNGKNCSISQLVKPTKYGLKFNHGYVYTNQYIINTQHDWTLYFRLKIHSVTGLNSIIRIYDNPNGELWIYTSGNTIALDQDIGGANNYYVGFEINKTYNVSFVYTHINHTASLYINGLYHSSGVGYNPTGVINNGQCVIGSTASLGSDIELHDLRLYSYASSAQEIKNYHNSFVKPYFLEDFSYEGADGIAKVPSGWVKQSGSFKVGELPKYPDTDLIINGDFVNDISGWLNGGGGLDPFGVFQWNNGLLHVESIIGGWKAAASTVFPVIAGKTYVVKINININSGSITFGLHGVTIGGMGRATYSGLTTGSYEFFFIPTITENIVFQMYSDTVINCDINYISIREPILPHHKNGTKYLECITAGALAIPSKQAYGTWEWDWYKGVAGSDIFLFPIADTGGSYYFRWYSDEGLYFRPWDSGGGFQTVNNYMRANTWYRIRMIRTLSGTFYFYIKGGAFGNDWILITPTSGANPYADNRVTSTISFSFSFIVGDRIANIKMLDGIIQ